MPITTVGLPLRPKEWREMSIVAKELSMREGNLIMEKTQPKTLWGGYEDEELRHETADEAIEAIIDDWDPPDDKTISVWEYKRRELPSVDYIRDGLIDWLRDDLDPEYGNPDEENEVPNEVYIAAERFAQVVRREWRVWTMERTENTVSVSVGEWKKEHE